MHRRLDRLVALHLLVAGNSPSPPGRRSRRTLARDKSGSGGTYIQAVIRRDPFASLSVSNCQFNPLTCLRSYDDAPNHTSTDNEKGSEEGRLNPGPHA